MHNTNLHSVYIYKFLFTFVQNLNIFENNLLPVWYNFRPSLNYCKLWMLTISKELVSLQADTSSYKYDHPVLRSTKILFSIHLHASTINCEKNLFVLA